jgi:predicted Fe-Mo cluster-binding NifX family protein
MLPGGYHNDKSGDRKLMGKVVRIGGAAGALNDSALAVPQLLSVEGLNYLIFDYLGEGAMALFSRMLAADANSGFLADFVDVHIGPHFQALHERGIKVVTNAGGMNPEGLAKLIEARARERGVSLRVAAVTGDNVGPLLADVAPDARVDMFSGEPLPSSLTSANAYLGALPIAEALARGADIVVTGRAVDSALALGPLIHEFGWSIDDYDRLAAGTAAGHLLECGTQVSGGTFTDWQDVPDWANLGFPVSECFEDGSFIITKPDGTGGLVTPPTVAEQLLYEVSDPQAYLVPDVSCDFSNVRLESAGPNRVRVSGVKGYPPTSTYKVSVTYDDGWRSISLQPIIGMDAPAKARRQADAILERTRKLLRDRNLGDWSQVQVEIIGTESSYGPHARPIATREVLLKIVVESPHMAATDLFWREASAAIMNMSVGTSLPPILATPRSVPVSHHRSMLLPKTCATAQLMLGDERMAVPVPTEGGFSPAMIRRASAGLITEAPLTEITSVPLVRLAYARSGDKGNLFNVGVIARRPELLPWIRAGLSEEAVRDCFSHLFADAPSAHVDCYEVPGIDALNFVVHQSLAGGMTSSLRLDPAAKSHAQMLLEMPIDVPTHLLPFL